MIGKVTFEAGGSEHTLTLQDGGAVECDLPGVKDAFERRLAAHAADHSPADGAWGVLPLAELARATEGRLELEDKPAPKAGGGGPVVY